MWSAVAGGILTKISAALRKSRSGAQTRRCTREHDCAATARHHRLDDLASEQKPGQRAHLPDLAIDALGGLGHAKAHIGASVKNTGFNRGNVTLAFLDQHQGPCEVLRSGGGALYCKY